MLAKTLPLILLCLAAPLAAAQQPETAIELVEGNEPTLVHYGAHTVGGQISPGTDLDLLTFQGDAGDSVRVRLRSHTNGFDPQIQVYDPSFALLDSSWCDGKSSFNATTCTVALDLPNLPASGTYTIVLSDVGVNEAGAYVFQIERFLPKIPYPGIPSGPTLLQSVLPSTDFDHLRFEGNAGSIVVVNVTSTSNGLDPLFELVDPSGAISASAWCDGKSSFNATMCSISQQLPLPLTGTYTLVLSDVGSDETGNVNISVTCILGNCASTPAGLTRDVPTASLSAGGTQNLALDGGPARAGQPFLVLGSASGHCPGQPLTPDTCLPLNADPYFAFTLNRPFQPPMSSSTTALDGAGQAGVTLTVPPGSPAALAGLTLTHAFLSFHGPPSAATLDFTSNPVTLELVP